MQHTRLASTLLVAALLPLAACGGGEAGGAGEEASTPADSIPAGMVTGTTGAPGPGTVGTPGTPGAVNPDTIRDVGDSTP